MASGDATPAPVKNQAYRVTFPILDADGDLVTAAGSLDSEVSKDGGTFADCTNEATEIATSSGMYYLDLTATEMNADTVAVIVKSTSGKTTPMILYPRTDGLDHTVDVTHWNGQAVATPTVNGVPEVDVTHWDGTALPAQATAGVPDVNVSRVSSDQTAADNLELDYDGTGYNKSTSTIGTCTTNTDMRGTDNAALASVLGALADAAAAGDPTSADTVMQYLKQLVNTLEGTAGIPTYPAEAAPGNAVSLAEAIRAIHADVTGLNGDAMRGTDSAALASVCTEARLAELDAANLPTDVAAVPTAAENADAVWDEDKTGHVGAGSTGEAIGWVDDILTDTGTTLPGLISTVDGKVDTAQADLDIITGADGVQLAASQTATWANVLTKLMDGAVLAQVNDASATTTAFAADGFTEATDDHYNGRLITFVTGALTGQQTDITDYDAAGGAQGSQQFTVTALTEAPANDVWFVIH